MSVDLTDKRTRKIDTSWKERERESGGKRGDIRKKRTEKNFFRFSKCLGASVI